MEELLFVLIKLKDLSWGRKSIYFVEVCVTPFHRLQKAAYTIFQKWIVSVKNVSAGVSSMQYLSVLKKHCKLYNAV